MKKQMGCVEMTRAIPGRVVSDALPVEGEAACLL